MSSRVTAALAAALLLLAPIASHAQLATYAQDFEALDMSSATALSADGWVVYGNVWDPSHTTYLYGYGTFPAPNGGNAFSAIVSGQGGTPQGNQQFSIYNDYNNTDQGLGRQIEANVFHEQHIALADVHSTWTFQFDAKMGNLQAPSKAIAFVKVINPATGYSMSRFYSIETDTITAEWHTYSISIPIDKTLPGQLMQFGFNSTTTNYIGSGIFYDNLYWFMSGQTGVGAPAPAALALAPAAPNPFAGSTRLDWTLPAAGPASLAVFDVAGRRVATLFDGTAAAGPHSAAWNGVAEGGRPAAAGVYRAVLRTAAGTVARNVVLTR